MKNARLAAFLFTFFLTMDVCSTHVGEEGRIAGDGPIVSGLFRYDVAANRTVPVPGIPKNSEITILRWSPDSLTLFAGTKTGLYLYDINGVRARPVPGIPADAVIGDIDVSADGEVVLVGTVEVYAGGPGRGMYRYDRRRDTSIIVSGIPDNAVVQKIAPDRGGSKAIVVASDIPLLYDIVTGDVRTMTGFPNDTYVRDVLWSAGDRVVFIGAAHQGLFRYDLRTGDLKHVVEVPEGESREGDIEMCMSGDGGTIVASTGTNLFLCDVISGRVVPVDVSIPIRIQKIELNADEGAIYWGIAGEELPLSARKGEWASASVFRCDITGTNARPIAGTGGMDAWRLLWSGDYRTLFIGGLINGGVRRYDRGGAAAVQIQGIPQNGGIGVMELSADGRLVLVGMESGGLFRYDIEARRGALVPGIPNDALVYSLASNRDGSLMLIDVHDHPLMRYDVSRNRVETLAGIPHHVLARKVLWGRDGMTAFIGTIGG